MTTTSNQSFKPICYRVKYRLMGNIKPITQTEFEFPKQKSVYHGKVRDVYRLEDKHIVLVASDRISAFDVVSKQGIPYKGQVLNQIAAHQLNATKDIVPNWIMSVPDPNATVGLQAEGFRIEVIVRGYLVGSAWRSYDAGSRNMCGNTLPDGMRENQPFEEPIITPTTKAEQGHDQDITPDEIIAQGLATAEEWDQISKYARAVFLRGQMLADKQGLILVDTKYEFGKLSDGTIILIDEIHTPDSSRYFYKDGYLERFSKAEKQKQLSKEFVREWLIEQGWQGQTPDFPAMPDEFIEQISQRYIELYELVTGEKFIPADYNNIEDRIFNNIKAAL